jgi:hypothetical protein
VIFSVSEAKLDNWALVGGQMVLLHLLERAAPVLRFSNDADVVVDIRARPRVLEPLVQIVESAGLEPLVSPDEVLHRWRSASGVIVDIMVPEGLKTPPKVHKYNTMMAPGGTQALRRSVPVRVVSADGTSGVVRRPSILGSILMKADAWRNDHTPERERHLRDIALLFNAVTDSELDGMRTELSGKERRRLADTPLMAGSDAEQWRPLGPTSADAYRRYAYLCAS